ncbi:MAG: S8 family peptidase [Patescibacteria group bacterium]|jgi:hypothetical protein
MKIKKIKIHIFSFLVLALLNPGSFFSLPVFANTPANYKAGEFLVKFKNNPQIYKFQFTSEVDPIAAIEKYQNESAIEYLEPNYTFQTTAFPNDPNYPLQLYLKTVDAQTAWSKELVIREQENITRRSVIAILDTGVDLMHPDLKDKIWVNKDEAANMDNDKNGYIGDLHGWDFVNNDADPSPSLSGDYIADAVKHGTIVAGIAAATTNNQEGIAGISWFSQIMPLRVLDSTGSGDVYSVVKAIDYAVANGADVINMSFVGTGFSQSLFDAIQNAYNRGVLIVAAAGNTDPTVNGIDLDLVKSYPVCYDGLNGENMVIGVASVSPSLTKSSFSSYGGCIDIVAPGENFYSTQFYQSDLADFNKYYDGYWSGTSLSAPLVSGTLASIKALRPAYNAGIIRDFVLGNTDDISSYNPGYENKLGSGLLDPAQALEAAINPKISPTKVGNASYIIAGLGFGSFPQVKILEADGSIFKSFYAYSPHFNGPINVAAADVNSDGKDEIITGAGAGGGPHVRVFNIEGQVVSQFFAYDKNSRGGVNVLAKDINNDNKAEIITGPGRGLAPEVRIFDYQGNLLVKFLAYQESFLGGVKVAAGDINKDGKIEIITGAGAGGGPHVRVFNIDGQVVSQFFAYNKNYKGGINVACGNLHGDGQEEIIVSVEKDSVPTVRVFDYRGTILGDFFAYEPNYLKGVYVASGDLENDGVDEIITGTGIGGAAKIKVFDLHGKMRLEILANGGNYQGGVRPALIRY